MRLLLMMILSVGVFLQPINTHAEETVNSNNTEITTPQDNITIENAYAFATAPGSVTGAAFMTFKNTGDVDDQLIKAESNIAKITEIHENIIDPDDGKMMMRKIKNIAVPSNGEAILEPTGKHIMLIQLKEPLTLDQTFPLTLTFEKSGEKIVEVKIVQPGLKPKMDKNLKASETKSKIPSYDERDNFPADGFSGENDLDEKIEHF